MAKKVVVVEAVESGVLSPREFAASRLGVGVDDLRDMSFREGVIVVIGPDFKKHTFLFEEVSAGVMKDVEI